MANIDSNYKELLNKSEDLRRLIFDAGGLASNLNKIKSLKDEMSNHWKVQGNMDHLNALVKVYSKLRSSVNDLNAYRKMLYDAGTEYRDVASKNESAAKGIK